MFSQKAVQWSGRSAGMRWHRQTDKLSSPTALLWHAERWENLLCTCWKSNYMSSKWFEFVERKKITWIQMMYCGKIESAGWMGIINKAGKSEKHKGWLWSQEYCTIYKFLLHRSILTTGQCNVTVLYLHGAKFGVEKVWLRWDIRLRVEPKLIHH